MAFCTAVRCLAATINVDALTESNLVYYSQNVEDGDIIIFPSGTCGVSGKEYDSPSIDAAVLWTNAVTLIFTPPTVITNMISDVTDVRNYIFRLDPPSGGSLRLTGATFNGNRTGSALSIGANSFVRVHDCDIVDVYGRAVMFWGYKAYGLVDNCTFTNVRIAVESNGGDSRSWNDPVDLGTTNAVVIEDCNFYFDDTGVPVDMLAYNGQGTRVVFRHNTVTSTSTNNVWFWDSHGNTRYLPADERGTIYTVLENNTVDIYKCPKLIGLRGGICMVISNTLSTTLSSTPIILTEEEAWNTALLGSIHTDYPAQDQITNTWIVANTYNSSAITGIAFNNEADAIFLQEGRDFWVTNVIPAGAGYNRLAYPHPLATTPGMHMAIAPVVFESTAGVIAPPFSVNEDGSISQAVQTLDPSAGGRAAYRFRIDKPDDYVVQALVIATSDAENSFFVGMDSEPFAPEAIWHIPPSSGLHNRYVIRPNAAAAPHYWSLSPGVHELVVRGREANCKLIELRIAPASAVPPSRLPSSLR